MTDKEQLKQWTEGVDKFNLLLKPVLKPVVDGVGAIALWCLAVARKEPFQNLFQRDVFSISHLSKMIMNTAEEKPLSLSEEKPLSPAVPMVKATNPPPAPGPMKSKSGALSLPTQDDLFTQIRRGPSLKKREPEAPSGARQLLPNSLQGHLEASLGQMRKGIIGSQTEGEDSEWEDF